MTHVLNVAFALWTASGLGLLLVEPSRFGWWSPVWILLFALAAYVGLVGKVGLASARVCAGVVIVGFSILLAVGSTTGWPTGPVRFTENSGPRVAGLFPALVPVFAFSLLALCWQAVGALTPSVGRAGVCARAAAGFSATVGNSVVFLNGNRMWWLWNPWDAPVGMVTMVGALLSLGVAAFGLAFIFPTAPRLHSARWSPAATLLAVVNLLFLVANGMLIFRKV